MTLREQLALEAAIDVAFAPLAARRAPVSAARVRAAARWGTAGLAASPGRPLSTIAGHLTELGSAAAVALVLLAGVSAAPDARAARPPSVIDAYFRTQPPAAEADLLRWQRLVLRTLAAAGAEGEIAVYLDKQ